jgi:hypothetical protein
MAIRNSSAIGQISGKLENTVTRLRYGKYIVYSKPEKYDISYSPEAVNGRAKFANTVKLACLLNSVPEVAAVWKAAKIKGTNSYQRIIKHNAVHSSHKGITTKNIITPPGSFILPKNIMFIEDKVIIKCITAKEFIFPPLFLVTLFSLFTKKGNDLSLLFSDQIEIFGDEYIQGIITPSKSDWEKMHSSRSAVILCAFISTNKKINWTSTFSFELYKKLMC